MSLETPVFRYTPLQREDVDAVVDVERLCFDSPWTPGQFRHEIKVPFSRTILAWDDSVSPCRLAGYVCRWAIGDELSILNLAVDPAYQKRGLGRALVKLVLDEAETQGAALITLEVREKNATARALYVSMGFAQTGLRRDYYGKSEHAIVMTKRLTADPSCEEGLCPASGGGV